MHFQTSLIHRCYSFSLCFMSLFICFIITSSTFPDFPHSMFIFFLSSLLLFVLRLELFPSSSEGLTHFQTFLIIHCSSSLLFSFCFKPIFICFILYLFPSSSEGSTHFQTFLFHLLIVFYFSFSFCFMPLFICFIITSLRSEGLMHFQTFHIHHLFPSLLFI